MAHLTEREVQTLRKARRSPQYPNLLKTGGDQTDLLVYSWLDQSRFGEYGAPLLNIREFGVVLNYPMLCLPRTRMALYILV